MELFSSNSKNLQETGTLKELLIFREMESFSQTLRKFSVLQETETPKNFFGVFYTQPAFVFQILRGFCNVCNDIGAFFSFYSFERF